MDTYQRPITPPTDQTKEHIRGTALPTANGGITTIPAYGEKDSLTDSSHLQRQQEALHNNRTSMSFLDTNKSSDSYPATSARLSYDAASDPTINSRLSSSFDTTSPILGLDSSSYNSGSTAPSSTYKSTGHISPPSAPTTSASISNPFNSNHENTSIPSTRKLSQFDQESASPNKKTFTSAFDDEKPTGKKYRGYGRNETTHRMETEVLSVLQWKNPIRSGVLFALIVGSIVLTRWYSLLQIGSTCLTLAIGINLIYVNLIVQSQKVLTNHEATHPYSDVIDNDRYSMIDRRSVNHYSTVITELSETVIRALTRIIFVEDTLTSIKWMSIFFAIWKISAHFSTMDIILMVVISAFTFPRLYISNKDVVDAQFQKGQTLLQSGIHKAQTAATENAQNTYVKAKAYVAQVGTTGTDAKNTMTKHSVTLKDDKSL